MNIYTKKIVELSEEEKNTLRMASYVLDLLADETNEDEYYRMRDDIRWIIENSPFTIENYE